MPKFKDPLTLLQISKGVTASIVHKTTVYLDSISWPSPNSGLEEALVRPSHLPPQPTPNSSPLNPQCVSVILSPSLDSPEREPQWPAGSQQNFPELCEQLKSWLQQMPVHLLELVVSKVISLVEDSVFQDKDHRLILTIINFEKCKPSDFSFGLHSLLKILSDTGVSQLNFSNKLWYCISEFEEIGSSRFMKRTLVETLPNFSHLTKVNLSYIATDKILFLLSNHCSLVEELSLDHSTVTDRGIRFLSGWSGVRRALFTDASLENTFPASFPKSGVGCPRLRYLSLDSCVSVTDQSLWYLLQHNPNIQVLIYHHQTYSVAEILCKEFSRTEAEISQFRIPVLNLTVMDHPFPYGLPVTEDIIKRVADHCPHIHTFNIVVLDSGLPAFSQISRLKRATVELEDYFSTGLLQFLRTNVGQNLSELTLSCSSDPDSTFIPGGGQSHQLFNMGIKLARHFCPNLTKLSLFGCGLVSNDLINRLNSPEYEKPRGLKNLRSLIVLTYYEDDNPVQTCEGKLLMELLKECHDLECLSLEGNFSTFMCDSYIQRLFQFNAMKKLKILDIRGTKIPLSVATVKRCLTLESIHELRVSAWSITDDEFNQVQSEVRQKGWDLTLTRRLKLTDQPA